VAHDFNNILAAMIMQVELMRTSENLPPDIREGLHQIRTSADRAAASPVSCCSSAGNRSCSRAI
jgi:signal transduction histidine kinase